MRVITPLIFFRLIFVVLFFCPMFFMAQWTYVGSPALTSTWCYTNDIAIDTSGMPVVALHADSTSILRYNGSQWEQVGSRYKTDEIFKLLIDKNNNYYLFYRNFSSSNAACMKFDGNNWSMLDSTMSLNPPAGFSATLDTAGVPYCFFNTSSGKFFVKWDGNNWQQLLTAGLPLYHTFYSLQFDAYNVPYLVYTDINTLRVNCMKYFGSNWSQFGIANFSSGYSDRNQLVITPAGDFYVAMHSNSLTRIKKYNSQTNQWDSLYFPFTDPSYSGVVDFIAADNGQLFLSTSFWANGRGRCVTYNGSNWNEVGTNGINDTTAGMPDIAISMSGTLYSSFNDFGMGKASVKKYDGAVGIKNLNENDFFAVFPNPLSDILNIRSKSHFENSVTVTIFNSVGNKMYSETFDMMPDGLKISMDKYNAGIYLVYVVDGSGRTACKRVLKQ